MKIINLTLNNQYTELIFNVTNFVNLTMWMLGFLQIKMHGEKNIPHCRPVQPMSTGEILFGNKKLTVLQMYEIIF